MVTTISPTTGTLSLQATHQDSSSRVVQGERMNPIPRPVNCEHPRLVKLVKFKGEHVVRYRYEVCGTHLTIPEQ